MTLVGVYIGSHDTNIAAFVDGRIRYAKTERLTGVKHHHAPLAVVPQLCRQWGLSTIDGLAFSDGNRNNLGCCEADQLYKEVPQLWGARTTYCIDHHYAHILSTWPLIPLEEAIVGLAIDGKGDNGLRTRVLNRLTSTSPTQPYSSRRPTFGGLFYEIGRRLGFTGPTVDFAGKLMGLQAFGAPNVPYVKAALDVVEESGFLALVNDVPFFGSCPATTPRFFHPEHQCFRDWLASVHMVAEEQTLAFFRRFCDPRDIIVYSGGCAQNVVINRRLLQNFEHLYIPPHCYDGGLALGCLEFLRLKFQQPRFPTDEFPFWQEGDVPCAPSATTIEAVADMLARGAVVAWFQGAGELGPRALGNRSLLVDPRRLDAPSFLNARVKRRESWRPYGASVLLSQASSWFEVMDASPYMLRAVRVRGDKAPCIPAVVHKDATCRIQTVNDDSNGPFPNLLRAFFKRTGVPLLLNTSLNGHGKPLCAFSSQVTELADNGGIDVVCVGDELTILNSYA